MLRSLTKFNLFMLCLFFAMRPGFPQTESRPRLAVVVVVDQMRADHLSRFAGVYRHGFARLIDEGAIFTEAHHDHAYTVTGAGHATIATGRHPSGNGIVGNDWFDRKENRKVYCCEDRSAPLLGYASKSPEAGRSPRNLLCSSLGDWLKERFPDSKVYGVSRKDRAAILSAGLKADGAYWYNDDDGNMITSEYYAKSYPMWVEKFNRSRVVDKYFQAGWPKLGSEETYFIAREDTFPTENDGHKTAFPYLFSEKSSKPDEEYYDDLKNTPFVDDLTFEFARALVENENLGNDETPDLLFINCSAADAVGHDFGPLSQESMDHFLRLDGYLGAFLGFLDDRIGSDNYVVALSSDHGVLPLPEELKRRGFDSERVSSMVLQAQLQKLMIDVSKKLKTEEPLILGIYGYGLLVNYRAAEGSSISPERLDEMLIDGLKTNPYIEDVFTKQELMDGSDGGREYLSAYAHSFHPERSPDLIIRIKEHYLVRGEYGTTHGSPYRYDTHVPLVFWGAEIKHARHSERVRTVDLAPTLADMLGMESPTDLDGSSLYETIRKQ